MAGGTPAFPASRVLGARASRSHGGKNALLGNASSRHARKKTYPFKGRLGGGHFENPPHRHLPTAQPKFTIPPSLRFPPLREGNRRGLVPPARRGNPEGGGRQLPFFVNFGSAIGIIPIASAYFTKTRVNENPLLKVPPASRGNRWAWFPSRSGENLKEGVIVSSALAIGIISTRCRS